MIDSRLPKGFDVTPPAPGKWEEISTYNDLALPRRRFVKRLRKGVIFCEIRTLVPIKHGVVLDNGLMAYFYIDYHSKDDKNEIEIISPFDERVLFDRKQEAFKINWQPWNWVDENGTLYRSTPSSRLMHPCLVGIEGMAYPAVWHPTKGFSDADNKPFRKYIEWWCFMPKPPERGDNVISFQGMETD